MKICIIVLGIFVCLPTCAQELSQDNFQAFVQEDNYPLSYDDFANTKFISALTLEPSASALFYQESLDEMERLPRNYLVSVDASGTEDMKDPVVITENPNEQDADPKPRNVHK